MLKQTQKSIFNLDKRRSDFILQFSILIASGMGVWGYVTFQSTVIKPIYLFILISIGAFATFALIRRLLVTSYHVRSLIFLSAAIGGAFLVFLLLFVNEKFASKEVLRAEFKAIETGVEITGRRRRRCHMPYAVVNFFGTEKQINFPCGSAAPLVGATIPLSYSKGGLGFEVIR